MLKAAAFSVFICKYEMAIAFSAARNASLNTEVQKKSLHHFNCLKGPVRISQYILSTIWSLYG